MQSKQILFVHGAGDGAHAEDQALATYLKSAVAPDYTVRYPRFLGVESAAYALWNGEMDAELAAHGDPHIVVAHSLGGAAVLKYLAQQRRKLPLAGLFLVGTPYTCGNGDWGDVVGASQQREWVIRNMPIDGRAPEGKTCVRCDRPATAEAWFAKAY